MTKKSIVILMGSLLVLASLSVLAGYLFLWPVIQPAVNTHWQAFQTERQRKSLDRRMIDRVEVIAKESDSLPPCPVLFPLLDAAGKITPLGSYLSYFAMKQASYLPKSVFMIPNAGQIYSEFDLFNAGSPRQAAYLDQLPYYFGNAKDFGEGSFLAAGTTRLIKLRFWGTRPEKAYQKAFAQGDLHLAIGWMAACLQDFAGFVPTPQQADYRDNPIFKKDSDLERGAHLETFFRCGGKRLITGWDGIVAKNPDNPYLFDRQLSILDARTDLDHLRLTKALADKDPENTFTKLALAYEYQKAGQHEKGLDICLGELKRDNNNPDWWNFAGKCLWGQKSYEASLRLITIWTELHPENQEAWMTLKEYYRDWAWVARGTGWAKSVTAKGWKLMGERMALAEAAVLRAAELAPGDCRVWSNLLGMGNGMRYDPEVMKGYFDKMFALNPYRSRGFEAYQDYLKPKWNGSEEELLEFSRTYDKYDPGLLAKAFVELYTVYSDGQTAEERKVELRETRAALRASPELPVFEKSYIDYLKVHPEHLGYWDSFMSWMAFAGRGEIVVEHAQTLARAHPDLEALPSIVFLKYAEEKETNLDYEVQQREFREDPNTVRHSVEAFETLAKLDPQNWHHANIMAFYCFKRHELRGLIRAFTRMSGHWEADVWPKVLYDQAAALLKKCPDCGGTGKAACKKKGCWGGTVICPNECLQLGDGDWVHMKAKGHPDSDIWRKYFTEDGGSMAWNQSHLGNKIEKKGGTYVDSGRCKVCEGKARVQCPSCRGKQVCVTCKGRGGLQAPKSLKGRRKSKT